MSINRLVSWLLRQSLWLVGVGMMLSSSGIDGAYLAKLMPPGFAWLGYVLNTTSDIGVEVLAFWFGRLQQDRSSTKRRRARWLLVAEAVLTGFAWFFGWRQLLIVLPAIEGAERAQWVAPIAAAFTPTGLIAVGYTQALLAGRIEREADAADAATATQPAPQQAQGSAPVSHAESHGNGHAPHECPYCHTTVTKSGEPLKNKQAVSAHLRYCPAYQAQKEAREAREEAE